MYCMGAMCECSFAHLFLRNTTSQSKWQFIHENLCAKSNAHHLHQKWPKCHCQRLCSLLVRMGALFLYTLFLKKKFKRWRYIVPDIFLYLSNTLLSIAVVTTTSNLSFLPRRCSLYSILPFTSGSLTHHHSKSFSFYSSIDSRTCLRWIQHPVVSQRCKLPSSLCRKRVASLHISWPMLQQLAGLRNGL